MGISIIDINNIIERKEELNFEINRFRDKINSEAFLLLDEYYEDSFKERKEEMIKTTGKYIFFINSNIDKFNKFLKEISPFWDFKKIETIKKELIFSILESLEFIKRENKDPKSIKERLTQKIENLKKDPPKYETIEENFLLKIDNILYPTIYSLNEIKIILFRKVLEILPEKDFCIEKYNEFIVESCNLYGLGYPHLALFIVGRTIEKIILDLTILLSKNKKIGQTEKDLLEMNAEKRLNVIKDKFISEKDYYLLKTLKFDRNVIAHFDSKEDFLDLTKNARSSISIGFGIIDKLCNLIKIEENTNSSSK